MSVNLAVCLEIERASLHTRIPWYTYLYTVPFLSLYPVFAYAYYIRYDDWIKSEEWTFLGCVTLGAGHALSFLVTQWSSGAKAWVETRKASSLQDADCIRITPRKHRGQGEIIPLIKKDPKDVSSYRFKYQEDTYVCDTSTTPPSFHLLPYPSDSKPELSTFSNPSKLGLSLSNLDQLKTLYGKNEFHIPIPTFAALFAEHATAPFFVFQVFCVALWCLDEYWYFSLFTLFMLVVFECTVVFQRVRTLAEFRTMSIAPYAIQCRRGGKWATVQTDELLPGDVVSIIRPATETSIPADLLILRGSCIVNEAMLSGESTPLLKESIELREPDETLAIDGSTRNSILFGGTKVLQASSGGDTPDSGALALVLRTGFGTSQGQLVRTMIFSTERVSANNFESFMFIGFLLIFAIAASWYVWTKGIERGLKKGKLLLDCVLIITSVVPPELPMELSLAVNASLVALSKLGKTNYYFVLVDSWLTVTLKLYSVLNRSVFLLLDVLISKDRLRLLNVKETSRETTLCLAAAHALVLLDDGTVVGDPMEKTALEALEWNISKGDILSPSSGPANRIQLQIRRRFQFSSALKRMSTVSSLPGGAVIAAAKGAPETIKTMLTQIPEGYDETFKWFTKRGSRVLALGIKNMESMGTDKINKLTRDMVESKLTFAGFLVFHCPLKKDAVDTLKMLADSSHRCIMITGDNPLTAVHVAKDVEIVDREVLILDLKEDAKSESDLVWRNVDETLVIPVDPSQPLDKRIFEDYDICVTGAAMKQYQTQPSFTDLVEHAWVYARVSPVQKELILTTLKSLGFTTLMAGDGTNDVGALKQADIGVALLDGTPEDLQKIAEHQRNERVKKVYESQLKISARFGQPPPPVPKAIEHLYPGAVEAQKKAADDLKVARQKNPMEKFDLASITDKMAELGDDDEPPQIKLGDASCAAPFTSKLSNVSAITSIIRQGRCTLVATIQMYKILALNCLITAYSRSVQYLDGIKYGDYQMTISGMLLSPVEKLSRERPLGNIFNLYVFLSIIIQFAIHIAAMLYITSLSHSIEPPSQDIDLDAKFEPNLLNTAIYLLDLSQQVSTVAINFQGRPFREGIRENAALYYGLLGAAAVAYGGAIDFMPEMSRWLQIVEMTSGFRLRLVLTMAFDFIGCYLVEVTCKSWFADLEPKPLVTRGRERREKRRAEEERLRLEQAAEAQAAALEKKAL
ncbi:hypothetical protein Clacol_007239 [Clathrus columnatus]|uniref:Uncharacterized protein n=1 Tax=Clathrus columnatus TaxID=1419009 RepID=A0AAV5AFE0_9AGAM|nr:hypothetical protein Clacol_007239 [Clathrus columnatus]